MTTRLDMLRTLGERLEAEQLNAVEALANGDSALGNLPESNFERIAHLHLVLSAVRDEVARHGPKMGFGADPLETK